MRNKFKNVLLIIWIGMSVGTSFGQQLPVYSQYMMNMFLINPALAGNDGYTSINLTAREQWIGLAQSPSTQSASFQTRILRKSYISKSTSVTRKIQRPSRQGRVGLGAHLFSDRNGMIRRTGVQLTYAYHIQLDEALLSFGLSAVGYQLDISEDGFFDTYEENDPLLAVYDRAVFIPDANFGAFYKTRDYYAGFSVVSIFQSVLKIGKQGENNYKMLRYYYLTGGYEFYLSDNFSIIPSILLKSPDNLNTFQMDLSGKLIYQESYWGGLSYRTPDAMIIFAGIRVENLFFGYAFDYNLSSIQKHTLGSHEFMFAIKFGDSARRYRWISRY